MSPATPTERALEALGRRIARGEIATIGPRLVAGRYAVTATDRHGRRVTPENRHG